MRAAAGTGVARRRLSTPDSRWAVTEMTRLMNAAAMMPSVMIPGTYETPVSIRPPATLTVCPCPPKIEAKITRNITGSASVKNWAWRLRSRARRSYRN